MQPVSDKPSSANLAFPDRAKVNAIIRGGLLLLTATAVGLTLLSSRPPSRPFGSYPAPLDIPNPLYSDSSEIAAYVTVTLPTIVIFPTNWHQDSDVCFVIQMQRTEMPGKLDFSDDVPQIQWNDLPNANFIVDAHTITGAGSDGSQLRLMNNALKPLISQYTPYEVQWFGQDATPILPRQTAGGLLCVQFQFSDHLTHLPSFLHINISLRNAHIQANPQFYFSYQDDVPADHHPPETIELAVLPISTYLARVVAAAPFAVHQPSAVPMPNRVF